MMRVRILLCVLVFVAFAGSVSARDNDWPVYPDGYVVMDVERWAPFPTAVRPDAVLPVVNERILDGRPLRWAAKRLATSPFEPVGKMAAHPDHWNLVIITCGRDRKGPDGWCGIGLYSTSQLGGSYYPFRVKGDPTRVGKRSLLGLGRRQRVGDQWSSTYYFADRATQSAFIADIVQARP